jgi:uncharacterized membrane protein
LKLSMLFFKNRILWKGLIGILFLGYPFLIYLFAKSVPLFYLLGCFVGLNLLRAASPLFRKSKTLNFIQKITLFSAIVVAVIMTFLYFWNSEDAPFFYPVMMSLTMSLLFGVTLLYPPSLIEQVARLTTPNLGVEGVAYTRKVTLIWCLFCLVNAGLSFITVIINNLEIWVLYNGCISYILIGLLISGEFIYRKCVMKKASQ